MNRRLQLTFSLLLCLAALALVSLPVFAEGPAFFPRNNMAPTGPYALDATVSMLGEHEVALRKHAAVVGSAAATNASPAGLPAVIGEGISVNVSDMGLNENYSETFMVVMDGIHGIILVEKSAYDSFDGTNYYFPNPLGDDSEPWLRTQDVISQEQLTYLLDQFDTVIYPTDTAMFGQPLPRGDEGQKVWILIHNIRDEAYYNPAAESYVAGYFSASEDAVNNKNMMHIDSYDWDNRTGPGGTQPYLYEGVFAHEFQHLIHFDQDPDEESWVDEGLADMAAFFCGYGHPSGHIAYYMVYHPNTSLTFFGDGLESYGASYLFQLYLYEKYGGAAFSSALVQEQANGIEGVQNTLAALGHQVSFGQVFDDWTIANYADDTRKAGGKYGYDTLEIGTMDTWGYSIPYALENMWWGPPDEAPIDIPSQWFGDPQPYTAQYYRFTNQKAATEYLDGQDFAGTPDPDGTLLWYSGAEAWAWRSVSRGFDIPAGGATLTFNTFYDIEEDWDYGYVEVYDHNDDQWYTLPALGTVDYLAQPQDNPNTPNHREPAAYAYAYAPESRWNAFTGSSGGWIPVEMDLTPFAGHTIDLYFTTWQDGAFTLQMMYVDDIAIPEIGFYDDVEAGVADWSSSGWTVTDGKFANGFQVVTVETKGVSTAQFPEPAGNSAMPVHGVRTLTTDPITQVGSAKVPATPAKSGRVQVAIVSNHAHHILLSDYLFSVR